MSQDLCQVRGTNLLVALLVVLFAISSWVDINGMFVELPILTQKLPEGWNLPSYMAVTIQIANIAPFVYTAVRTVRPQCNIEVPVIYGIIGIGILSCFLLVFFWDATAVVAGNVHSVGLLSLQFFLALVDCTSSVAYLPFMGAFKRQYLPAFYVGEGFSGLLPSLVALAQGAGEMRCVNETIMQNVTVNGESAMEASFIVYPMYETPKFSIEIFFGFLFSMLLISCISFSLLNFWPYVKKEKVDLEWERSKGLPYQVSMLLSPSAESYELDSSENQIRFLPQSSSGQTDALQLEMNSQSQLLDSSTDPGCGGAELADSVAAEGEETTSIQRKLVTKWEYVVFLLLTAWVNGLANGTLPSIQTFSCLPYGIDAYHLAVTLSTIANPVACFCLFFVQAKSVRSVSALSVLGSVLAAYVLYTAASSPSPPLSRHALGSASVVTAWVLVVFFLTYTKISIAAILREEGRRALLWCGAFTQIGSLVGALVTFVVVNIYGVFQQADMCA
ncbi:riboflavin transporter 2-like [Babylonia areolata]|uniref:riboflavin transporter 2-like n=1 Tax=Babylonia areolata TaxID=304850 RepID=UPI003FD23ED4